MLTQDLRYALRTLARTPAFSMAAVLTIAFGIAANASVFSAVNAALVRSLPYPDAGGLMQVAERNDKLGIPFLVASPLNYLSWKEQTRTMQLGAFGFGTYALTGRGDPEQVVGGPITSSLIPLLGLRPVAGRSFAEREDAPGAPPVALISEALWQRRFGGDPAVLDRPLVVNGNSCTLVGVMGPELTRLTGGDLWIPMAIDRAKENRLAHYINVVGRLAPGVSMDAAQAEMNVISRRVADEYPEVVDWTIQLRSFYDWFVSAELRTALVVIQGAVALVLLVVCANIANLLLARAVGRQHEFAIRTAMGASRARIARQLVTEGLLLSLAGGCGGLLLAVWAVRLYDALPTTLQPVADVRIDAAVLLFTLGAAAIAGILFSLAPAWYGTRPDVQSVLKQGGRTSRHQVRARWRNLQVGAQLAFATVLVVAAGLLAQSLLRLQQVPLGYDPSNVLMFRLALPAAKYPDHTRAWAFYTELLQTLDALPGVRSTALSSALPFGGGVYNITSVSTPSRSGEVAMPSSDPGSLTYTGTPSRRSASMTAGEKPLPQTTIRSGRAAATRSRSTLCARATRAIARAWRG